MTLKGTFTKLMSKTGSFLGLLLVCLLYSIVGGVMAAPYVYLAGWNTEAFMLAPLILPVTSLILYSIYVNRKMTFHGRTQRWISKLFWGLLGYCLLPILANGISITLRWMQFEAASNFVFTFRYASLITVPIAAFIGLGVYWFAIDVLHRFTGKGKPPSNTPPNGSDSNKALTSSERESEAPPNAFQYAPTSV